MVIETRTVINHNRAKLDFWHSMYPKLCCLEVLIFYMGTPFGIWDLAHGNMTNKIGKKVHHGVNLLVIPENIQNAMVQNVSSC